MLSAEDGAKFLDRVKSNVTKFGEQNLNEKPTYNAIIAVLKSAIPDREPALYHLADLHEMQLDFINKSQKCYCKKESRKSF